MMLTITRMKVTMIAAPGTNSASSEVSTWLNDSIACANVPTKMPIANWLGLSCKMLATMRGENCPIAS
jgi:hypothetical protein